MHKEIEWLYSLEWMGWKLSLDRIREVMKALGNPEKAYKIIHIAGTNGKGSTAAMLNQILIEAGHKVGMFTSPHLVKLNERYRVNNQDISDEKLCEIIRKIRDLKIEVTCFEFMTAIAFLYFKEVGAEYVVLEVGLGGTYDATNIITPIASVITTIANDHNDILGDIQDITEDKAGVIKENIPLFTCENNPLIKKACKEQDAKLVLCSKSEYSLNLNGQFQSKNAGIAIKVARHLQIDEQTIKKALQHIEWKARLEYLDNNVILDSAHNPNAIEEVAKFLKTLDYENLYVIFSCLKDKNAEKMLKALPPHKELIITKIHFHRAMELGDIYKAEPGVIIENVKNAMDHVKEKLQQNDLLIILGSVYLAGEVLEKQIM